MRHQPGSQGLPGSVSKTVEWRRCAPIRQRLSADLRPHGASPSPRHHLRVWVKIMGSQKYENVGESQSLLIMNDPIISPRTRMAARHGCCRRSRPLACASASSWFSTRCSSTHPPRCSSVGAWLGGVALCSHVVIRTGLAPCKGRCKEREYIEIVNLSAII
eukprot:COSAG01_NODE_1803_length_9197_cov_11.062321_5_plen_161_part_00